MLAVYVGAAVASTRGVFAMARDRRLPGMAGLGVQAVRDAGRARSCCSWSIQAILIVVSRGERHAARAARVSRTTSRCSCGARRSGRSRCMVVYFLMSIGGLSGVRRATRDARGVIVAALVGIVITAAAIFGSFYKVTSPTLLAPWSAVIWCAIGLVVHARWSRGASRRATRWRTCARARDAWRGRRGRPAPPRPHPEREPHARPGARSRRARSDGRRGRGGGVRRRDGERARRARSRGGRGRRCPRTRATTRCPGTRTRRRRGRTRSRCSRRSRRRRHGSGWSRARSSRRCATRCCSPSSSRRSTCCPRDAWSSSRR